MHEIKSKSKRRTFLSCLRETFVANVLIMNAVLWHTALARSYKTKIVNKAKNDANSNDDDNCNGKATIHLANILRTKLPKTNVFILCLIQRNQSG